MIIKKYVSLFVFALAAAFIVTHLVVFRGGSAPKFDWDVAVFLSLIVVQISLMQAVKYDGLQKKT